MGRLSSPFFLNVEAHVGAAIVGLFETIIALHCYVFVVLALITVAIYPTDYFNGQIDAHTLSVIKSIQQDFWGNFAISSLIWTLIVIPPLLLLLGVQKRKRWFMVLWLAISIIRTLKCSFAVAWLIKLNFEAPQTIPVTVILGIILADFIYAHVVVCKSFRSMATGVGYAGLNEQETSATSNDIPVPAYKIL